MKSPSFQFYPDDFVGSGSVGTMTPDEVGIYVLLMCLEWSSKGFEYDPEKLARWCRTTVPRFERAWKEVSKCFKARGTKLFNNRLSQERVKQREWRAKSSDGGIKSGIARRKARKGGVKMVEPNHEPNTNTPTPSPSPLTTSPQSPSGHAAFEACWSAYPRRAGGNSKLHAERAFRATLKRGISSGDILAGVERYRTFCESTGKIGTEFVKMAGTFFGPAEPWREIWTAPPPRLTREQEGGLADALREQRREAVGGIIAGVEDDL